MDSEIEVLVFKPSSHFTHLLPSKCQVIRKWKPMSESTHTLRIFVSFFSDLKDERNAFQERAFPR